MIYDFFKERFQDGEARLSEKLADLEEGLYILSVRPLYKEVLREQESLLVCQWLNRLGFDCNSLKSEWLAFTFTLEERPYGYELSCILDGKCSEKKNIWGQRGLYKDIDADESSTAILQEYGDEFMGALRRYILARE